MIQNHAERLKQIGRKHGFTLSIEPYDMTPVNDLDLGAFADVPQGEFWHNTFNSAWSFKAVRLSLTGRRASVSNILINRPA